MKQKGWREEGKDGAKGKKAEEWGEQQGGGGGGEGGERLLLKESRIHLKVNRNSLAPFRGTSVTPGGGGGAFRGGQRDNVNAGAATHFKC